jgi:hypothetical protein
MQTVLIIFPDTRNEYTFNLTASFGGSGEASENRILVYDVVGSYAWYVQKQ